MEYKKLVEADKKVKDALESYNDWSDFNKDKNL